MQKLLLTQFTELDIRRIFREEMESVFKENFKKEEQDIVPIQKAMKITSLARQTIYGLVNSNDIPFIKSEGHKKLFFSRIALLEWIKNGREHK
ncbi:MAG: helix-turn-helix domain-containing protein [Bacteroidota bacterium]